MGVHAAESLSDLPRSVRHGPRITLTCKCGEKEYVQYGETWTCDKCGKRWNTRKIPLEQYAAVRATQLKFRRVPIAIATFSLVCVVAFIIGGKPLGGVVLVALCATAWSMFARPFHKRKYREAVAKLPSWEIEPE